MPRPDREADYADDVLDLIMAQRQQLNEQIAGERMEQGGNLYPPELMRR
jgi:hypothetical protein